MKKEIERVKLPKIRWNKIKNIKSAEEIAKKITGTYWVWDSKKEIEETLKKINKENNDTEIRIENILNEKNRLMKRQNLEITIRKNEQNIKGVKLSNSK